MMIWTATLSAQGTLELPEVVRDKLGVKPGEKIILAEHDGRFELRREEDLLRWYGAQPVDGPQDWKQVRQDMAVARALEVVHESESD
jgi:bifunctional DNA-binding transcriptional regulator/antitoxin component of YhaV-PrlF toxin-antitoxin module